MRTTRQPSTPDLRLFDPAELDEPAPDPLDGLLTPSRDLWYSVVEGEVRDLLERHDMNIDQKTREFMRLMEREQRRGSVGEER